MLVLHAFALPSTYCGAYRGRTWEFSFRVSDGELLEFAGALVLPLALFLNAAMLLLADAFAWSFRSKRRRDTAESWCWCRCCRGSAVEFLSAVEPAVAGYRSPILGQYALAADVLGGKPPAGRILRAGGGASGDQSVRQCAAGADGAIFEEKRRLYSGGRGSPTSTTQCPCKIPSQSRRGADSQSTLSLLRHSFPVGRTPGRLLL